MTYAVADFTISVLPGEKTKNDLGESLKPMEHISRYYGSRGRNSLIKSRKKQQAVNSKAFIRKCRIRKLVNAAKPAKPQISSVIFYGIRIAKRKIDSILRKKKQTKKGKHKKKKNKR